MKTKEIKLHITYLFNFEAGIKRRTKTREHLEGTQFTPIRKESSPFIHTSFWNAEGDRAYAKELHQIEQPIKK